MTIQIALVIISIVIIATYIRPTFDEMQATQDETREYREALDNATEFNQELQRLVDQANNFSTSEMRALERYLPAEVDTIGVMRDIETIVDNNQMNLATLSAGASGSQDGSRARAGQGQNLDEETGLNVEQFTLSVAGTYDQFKQLLRDFERNAYPLEVANLMFTPAESTQYSFTLTLETYSLNTPQE